VDTVGITSLPSEDPVSERRRKLEYLEMQEELIKVLIHHLTVLDYACLRKLEKPNFGCSRFYILYLLYLQEEEEKEEEELTRIKDVKGGDEDKALQEMTIPTASEAQEQARARVLEQQDDLCKLSRALGVLASASVRKMSLWLSTMGMQSSLLDIYLILCLLLI